MDNDAISRSALINDLKRVEFHEIKNQNEYAKELYQSIKKLYNSIISFIETFHALDAVQVVRCMECKFRGDGFRCPLVIRVGDAINFLEFDTALDDDFCSRGKRKESKEG